MKYCRTGPSSEQYSAARFVRHLAKVAIHVPAGITRGVSKKSLHAVFTRYLRGNHVWYIYVNILKYTVNTGDSLLFLVVGGRRVFKFRVWCACLSLYSPFLSSRPFLPPCACAFSCSVHRHAMDHGCAHTDKCEMLLIISSRFHDDVTLF